MELIRRLDVLDRLDAVSSRSLVIVGDRDPVTPVGAAEEVVAALPNGSAQLQVVAGAGHFPWLDAPDRFWPSVLEFVAAETRSL